MGRSLPEKAESIQLGQDFPNLALLHFVPDKLFDVGACPVHCRTFISVHGLHPVDTSSASPPTPVVTMPDVP